MEHAQKNYNLKIKLKWKNIMNYEIGGNFFDKFDWGCYMEAYKETAKILLDDLSEDQTKNNRNKILPTMFLVRHFLELSFKEILSHENYINKNEIPPNEHNLKKLWEMVKPLNKKFIKKTCEIEFKAIEMLVDFFEQYDKQSFSFRYPKDNQYRSIFLKDIQIPLGKIKSYFDIAEKCLSKIITQYILNDKYYE